MKRSIMAVALSAVAILGSASLSWGIQATLDTQAFNFAISTNNSTHVVSYAGTNSAANALVTPTTGAGTYNSTGAGGFVDGLDASSSAQDSNTGAGWAANSFGGSDLVPTLLPNGIGGTPVDSGYTIVASSTITNGGAGTPFSATADNSLSQDYSIAGGTGTGTISLDFDWLYNLTVVPGGPSGYTYSLFVNAVLGASNSFNTYSALTSTGLIDDGADHLTHVTVFLTGVPLDAIGTFSVNVGSTLNSTSVAVPEPSTLILAGSGLLGIFFMRRRSRS